MKNKIITLIIIIISLLAFMSKTNALEGYTTGTFINVRNEPNVNGTNIGQIKDQNTIIDVISEELYNVNDSNCQVGWYKINYNGRMGYICGEFVSLGSTGDNNPSYNESGYEARIYGTSVSVRYNASYNNSAKTFLLPGTNVVILDKEQGSGCSDGWYHIRYYKNDTGYVCASYVKTIEELTSSNESYEKELKTKGFPDSYIPYLVKLHEQHPNWTFNAINTNVDWNTLIRLETRHNYINEIYINSAVSNLYQVGMSNESGWFIASDEVNAFYLDPRNFLSERFIVMFQHLNYQYDGSGKKELNKESAITKQYYNSITKLLGNSYANTDEYKYWFIDAGFTYNVNPVYLVSLSYQEGPLSSASNPSILGTHSSQYIIKNSEDIVIGRYDLNGYYNFFNIGAYKEGDNKPVTRGLAYACGPACTFNATYGRPWNTVQKAIYGGTYWIADGYIASGQNTIYFKKFDTSPTSPTNTASHQYQTNVTAPASEAEKMYESYVKTNVLNEPYTFDIPIYNNMPSIISLPNIASTNNNLSEIIIDGKKVHNFDPDVIEYVVYIPNNYTSVKVEATKSDNLSKIDGLGVINTSGNTIEHKITVTAENGAKKTYKITLIKAENTTTVDDIVSNLSVTINGNVMSNISPETAVNTLVQSILKNSPTSEVTVYDSKGVVLKGASFLPTGGKIKITAPSGSPKEYELAVTGDIDGNGIIDIIDLLRVQKHILKINTLSGSNYTAADTNKDGTIDIIDLLRVRKHILKIITL